MTNLSDFIEDYLKKLLALSLRRYVDVQRGTLARKFDCVPSQINYVLKSRFPLERGYLVESRRGGRGYIRIYRVDPAKARTVQDILDNLMESNFGPEGALHFLKRLREENTITWREFSLLESLLGDEHYNACRETAVVRAIQSKLLCAALKALLKEGS